MNTSERIFFPILFRRKVYALKRSGDFYSYSHYREEIAEDCQHRCVYCDAHANEVGGAEAMQLDHFRPESFEEFNHLINDPRNLHYACGRCNLWKSDWWPARGSDEPHNGTEGFIDPFFPSDRLDFYEVLPNGEIRALKPPASYVIRLLRMNREYLRKLRELRFLKSLWLKQAAEMKQRAESGILPTCDELLRTLAAIDSLLG